MKLNKNFIGSSIGKKVFMAISGTLLTAFVIGHMGGNLQMFLGPDAINAYAHQLQNMPYGLLWVVRLSLLGLIVMHIVAGLKLTLENRSARPSRYEVDATVRASFASRTMPFTGFVLLVFIVFHVLHFTTKSVPGMNYTELPLAYLSQGGHEIKVFDVYSMVVSSFTSPVVTAFYGISMAFLCLHLSHGISSVFQTFGLRNAKWRPRLDRIALVLSIFIFLGFVSVPVAVITGLIKKEQPHTASVEVVHHQYSK